MARALFVLVLVSSFEASGRSLELPVPGALDLATLAVVEVGKGDLSISGGLIRAPHGIRMASSGPAFLPALPLVMDAPLLCRAADGRELQVTVLADAGSRVMLEVRAPGQVPAAPAAIQGTFVLVGMAVDGLATDLSLPPLRLRPDGTYQLGSARGRFEQRPRWLVLDGYYGAWGPAEIAGGGELLVFRFRRGVHLVQAMLQRVEEAPGRALVASP